MMLHFVVAFAMTIAPFG